MGSGPRRFVLRHVNTELVASAHEFHRAQLTEYLYPRGQSFFSDLAEKRALFAAFEGETIVCVCYLLADDEGKSFEFGGVCVAAAAEGLGLASALGRCAIIAEFARNAPVDGASLIAHVHSENDKPRPLLQRLGFHKTRTEAHDMPPHVTMKRNADGKVEGDLFEFPFAKLAELADWLERYRANARENLETVINIAFMEDRAAAVTALRHTAAGYTSKAV